MLIFILGIFVWPLLLAIVTGRISGTIVITAWIGWMVFSILFFFIGVFCVPKSIVDIPDPKPYFDYLFLWARWGAWIGAGIGAWIGYKLAK